MKGDSLFMIFGFFKFINYDLVKPTPSLSKTFNGLVSIESKFSSPSGKFVFIFNSS